MEVYIDFSDLILFPIYLFIVIYLTIKKKKKYIDQFQYYKYYSIGLYFRIICAIGFCIVYIFYYKGGDTLLYFDSSKVMLRLMTQNFSGFLDILVNGNQNMEQFSYFNYQTGYPCYWADLCSFYLIRLVCLIVLISCKSYLVTTLLIAWISYSGIWRLYVLFCKEFPLIIQELSIAFLFVPSVAFWGSGLLKDTVTYSACCWFTIGFYYGVIKRGSIIRNAMVILTSSYLILSIKPYILYCLIPGAIVWMISGFTNEIKSGFFKVLIFPLVCALGVGGLFFVFKTIGNNLGKWSVNEVLERAVITQNDLVQDYYGGNSFNIGKFDATISSMLAKSPQALMAGLFRPFIFEAKNPVMIISGLENGYLLIMTIYVIFKLKFFNIIYLIQRNNLLLYSLFFALFFAFMVGLSTPNFGSLVRYRIPAIPFYLASLFILKHYSENKRSTDQVPSL